MNTITKKVLRSTPILFTFLLDCLIKQSTKKSRESFLFTPDMFMYEQHMDVLEQYISFIRKDGYVRGATIPMHIADLKDIVDTAFLEYTKKISYDVNQIVKNEITESLEELKLTISTSNNLKVSYNRRTVGTEVNPVNFYQKDSNQSIAERVVAFIKCYNAAKAVAEKSNLLEFNHTCEHVGVEGFMLSYQYLYGIDNSESFISKMKELEQTADKMNKAAQVAEEEFSGIRLGQVKIGEHGCHIPFFNPVKSDMDLVICQLHDVKSAANRARSMICQVA